LKIVLIPVCLVIAFVGIALVTYAVLGRRKSKQSVQAKGTTKTSTPDTGGAILTQSKSLLSLFCSRKVVSKVRERSPPPPAEGTYELGAMPVAGVREMV